MEEMLKFDQEAKKDAGKPRLSLVPTEIVWDVAVVREYAVRYKYHDPDNWKRVDPQRYRDALLRHTLDYAENPYLLDEETGIPTLWHAAANMSFLCDLAKKDFQNPRLWLPFKDS